MFGDEWILDGMERGCEVVSVAASIAEVSHQPRDEKMQQRGKAALALQDSWFADPEQLPQNPSKIVRRGRD